MLLPCNIVGIPTAASVFEDRSRSSLEVVSPWPLMSNATTRYLNAEVDVSVTDSMKVCNFCDGNTLRQAVMCEEVMLSRTTGCEMRILHIQR